VAEPPTADADFACPYLIDFVVMEYTVVECVKIGIRDHEGDAFIGIKIEEEYIT